MPTPTSHEVIDYLKTHPGFFQENEELLTELELANNGDTSPFLKRQLETLRERESRHKETLNVIVDSARNNQKLEDGFLEFSVALLSKGQADGDVSENLSAQIKRQFDVKDVSVLLASDEESEKSHRYDEVKQRVAHRSSVCDDRLASSLLDNLFGENAEEVKSCAFIPLLFEERFTGILVLGSSNRERFQPGMGVIFLDRLGLLVASYFEGRK